MINPILIIAAGALFCSMLTVSIINKPKIPLVTASLIFIFISYIIITFMLDGAIVSFSAKENLSEFIQFVVLNPAPKYTELEESFHTLSVIDIIVFFLSIISLLLEAMIILRKDSKK